jgi:L-seryl-tRNA(Ser) seleniumtransferase
LIRLFYDTDVAELDVPELYRQIPSITVILEDPAIVRLIERYSRHLVIHEATNLFDEIRSSIRNGELDVSEFQRKVESLPAEVEKRVEARLAPSLRPLINATGVLVFTNGGRAPIAPTVLEALRNTGGLYTNLEYDLEQGCRGHRDLHFEGRVTRLLGCEAATVCNNAAAALVLILNTLALGKRVLVSRGELIEIGGSFRLPAVMKKSGAILAEVGTTNKTRASDYAEAIDDETALILRVHTSNFSIVGFTERPKLAELVEVARQASIPLVHDVGSGCLFQSDHPALAEEPTVTGSLRLGSDLICFSGDKLFGGPQAGLIVGRRSLVDDIRRSPLMRAFRVDKLIYTALEQTLIEYEADRYEESLPVWRFLRLSPREIRDRARKLLARLPPGQLQIEITEGFSLTGGGSAPQERIPTELIALTSLTRSPNEIERALRHFRIPILTRIEDDQVLLDLRTVFPDQDDAILEALGSLN